MIVGTAGHIDHGKTALVKALTGTDTDRLAEEKARGITIELGFAYTNLAQGAITGFVDVPGHERLIHTMLAGAGGIDFALMVVAADDGVMPQTREHLAILDLLGVVRGIVAMTKADLAGPERRAEVLAGIRATLAPTGLRDAPVLPVSVVTGEGIADLRAMLGRAEAETAMRRAQGPFRLTVDRSFTLAGTGTVVTGTVVTGRVAVGDSVIVSPTGLVARVRGIHAQNREAQEGIAGQRCALNLAGESITKASIRRGDVVLTPGLHAPSDRIDAELTVLASEARPLSTWFPARLHSNAAEVGARVVALGGPAQPGASGLVQLVLDTPIAAAAGDRFILRDVSASRTIGGGRFLDLRAPRRKRRTDERMATLTAAALPGPGAALERLTAVAPVDLVAFLRDRSLAPDAAGDLVTAAGATVFDGFALSSAHLARLETGARELLAAFHANNPELPGLGRERLRLQLSPRLSAGPFLDFLRHAIGAGTLALEGAFVRLPSHEVRLTEADETLVAQILPELLGDVRFRPPRVRDLAQSFAMDEREVRRVMRLTQRLGLTDQIAHDHFFAREVTTEMVRIICDIVGKAPDGWFTAATFRDRVHNGRKVAIEILEFFDRHGITLRRGDQRRINPPRIDQFEPSGRESSPVGRPDFKSGWGSQPAPGGFDSHSLPPDSTGCAPG